MASDFNWKAKMIDPLRSVLARFQPKMGSAILWSLYASVLWPIVEAFNSDDPAAVWKAAGELRQNVATSLLSDRIGEVAKQKTIGDTAQQLERMVADEPGIRAELNTLLQKLDVLTQAVQELPENNRQNFINALREELQRSGNFAPFSQNVIFTGTIHHLTLNVTQSVADQRAENALNRYRRVLETRYQRLALLGIDLDAGNPTHETSRPDLAKVYVNLNTTATVPVIEEDQRRRGANTRPGEEKQEPLSALEAVRTNRRIVLLGDPGSGKSTFVNHLVLCLAKHGLDPFGEWLARLQGWSPAEAAVVPLVIILRDFARQLPSQITEAEAEVGLLQSFVTTWFENQGLAAIIPLFEERLDNGHVVLLFDGLDEVRPEQRAVIRKLVVDWATQYPTCRLVVTCRILSYQDPGWRLPEAQFSTFTLAPFDEDQIHAFIDAWYGELAALSPEQKERAEYLMHTLRQVIEHPEREELREFAANPLLLTMMAQTHAHAELPNTRAQLYNQVVNMLLHQWDQLKVREREETPVLKQLFSHVTGGVEQLRPKLEELAYAAHHADKTNGDASLVGIPQQQIEAMLAPFQPKQNSDWMAEVIGAIQQRAGLLLEREPGVYTFPHLTFQEYLAGAHLATLRDSQGYDIFTPKAVELADTLQRWRNAIVLSSGHIVYVIKETLKLLPLLGELCPQQQGATERDWQKMWLAGEILVEIGKTNLQVGESNKLYTELRDRVRHRLVDLLQGGHLSPVERARAGDTLAALGDPRFDEDLWCLPKEDLLGFVKIPAGSFLMGSDKRKDPGAYDGEFELHQVLLPQYYIARYPVTVAQFRAFVKLSGYGWEGKDETQGSDTHPVVYVTWHDAIAYCDWLTEVLRDSPQTPPELAQLLANGGVITLPSEAEWEKAARGEDGWIYPWKGKFDANNANVEETGIGKTSTVGCFPGGKSPYGILDMSGNVWEWTRSLWGEDWQKPQFKDSYVPGTKDYEDLSAPNNVLRVLRGGAFWGNQRYARCAYRDRYYPFDRNDLGGFRVVACPKL